MNTKLSAKFESVNPRITSISDLPEQSSDSIFTFDETNFKRHEDYSGKFVYKTDFTKEQFSYLSCHEFPVHRLFVTVLTRPNLKDGNQFLMCAGMKQYEEAFNGEKTFIYQNSYYLEYPERWLNIIEQRCLYTALMLTYPNCSFSIKTHSVYIIQCTRNNCVGVVREEPIIGEGNIFNYNDFICGTIRSCDKFDAKEDGKLQVL